MRRKGDLSGIPGKLKRLAHDYSDTVLNYGIKRVSFDRFRKMKAQEVSHILCGGIIEIVFSNGNRVLLINPDSYPEICDSKNICRVMREESYECEEFYFGESGFVSIPFSYLKKGFAPKFFSRDNCAMAHKSKEWTCLALILCERDSRRIFKAAEKVAQKDGEPLYYSSLFPVLKRGGGEKSGNRMLHKERIDIMSSLSRGVSVAEIARSYGVSRQAVYNVRKKCPAPVAPKNIKFFTGKTEKPRKSARVSFEAYNDNIGYDAIA